MTITLDWFLESNGNSSLQISIQPTVFLCSVIYCTALIVQPHCWVTSDRSSNACMSNVIEDSGKSDFHLLYISAPLLTCHVLCLFLCRTLWKELCTRPWVLLKGCVASAKPGLCIIRCFYVLLVCLLLKLLHPDVSRVYCPSQRLIVCSVSHCARLTLERTSESCPFLQKMCKKHIRNRKTLKLEQRCAVCLNLNGTITLGYFVI